MDQKWSPLNFVDQVDQNGPHFHNFQMAAYFCYYLTLIETFDDVITCLAMGAMELLFLKFPYPNLVQYQI